jgi:PIN domain nuclease of toxin-antitoxin system
LNLLLDTHVWLWWIGNNPNLSQQHREAIASPQNRVFFSAISIWEANIKKRIGRLSFEGNPTAISLERGFEILSFTAEHAAQVLELPLVHKDPFDHALISQALAEDLTMVTVDRMFKQYPGLKIYPPP